MTKELMYEIEYDKKENENSEWSYHRKYQIMATTEQNALVKLGLMHHEDRVINVVSVRKVFGYMDY